MVVAFQPFPCFVPGTDLEATRKAQDTEVGKSKRKCVCWKGYQGSDCGIPAPVGSIENNSK